MHSRDVPKTAEIVKNDENFANETIGVLQENSDKIDKNTKSCIPQNISKIPRIKLPIKPNSFLCVHEESGTYPV